MIRRVRDLSVTGNSRNAGTLARIPNYLCLNPRRGIRHACDRTRCAYIACGNWDPFGLDLYRGGSSAHRQPKRTPNSNAITLCDRCEINLFPALSASFTFLDSAKYNPHDRF